MARTTGTGLKKRTVWAETNTHVDAAGRYSIIGKDACSSVEVDTEGSPKSSPSDQQHRKRPGKASTALEDMRSASIASGVVFET